MSACISRSSRWQEAVRFHGHACPGLAIGLRMALAAARALDLTGLPADSPSPDEELVCVAETDACCVDAIQLLLGCTLGKGNLLLKLRGKTAMSFHYRPAQQAIRIIWLPDIASNLTREERMAFFLSAPEEKLLLIRQIEFAPPARALVCRSLPCAGCGEATAEYAIRLRDGRYYCLDCWPEPSRIL